MLQLVPQAVAQDAGPFTFPGARIEGVGDITQFIVKAAPTQTNNLVEIQDNSGSALAYFRPPGDLTILMESDATYKRAALFRNTTSTNSPDLFGAQGTVWIDANNTTGLGGSAPVGLRGSWEVRTGRTTTAVIGISTTGTIRDGASATSTVGMYLQDPSLQGSGTVANTYGIYLESFGVGTATNYAIYSKSGTVSFGDDLEFRQAATISTTSGDLTLDPAGILEISSNTIVGSTTVVPDGTLHVYTASAGAITPDAFADDFIVEGGTLGGMSIYTSDAGRAALYAATPSNAGYHGLLFYGNTHATLPATMSAVIAGTPEIYFTTGEMQFQQAQTISTTSGDLTLDPATGITEILGTAAGNASIARISFRRSDDVEVGLVGDDTAVDQYITLQGTLSGVKIKSAADLRLEFSTVERVRFHNSGGVSIGNVFDATDPGADNVIIEGLLGVGTTTLNEVLNLAGNLEFQQASTISTTAGDLTLDSAADIVIAPNTVLDTVDIQGQLQIWFDASTQMKALRRATSSIGWITAPGADYVWSIETSDNKVIVGSGNTYNAKFRVDQGGSTASIPALYLHQRDYSEQAIIVSYNAIDQDMILIELNVTGTPQFNWKETPDMFDMSKGLQLGGDLDFQQASTISTTSGDLTITPAGSTAIGSGGSDGTLHVHTASAGTVTAHTNYDDLVIENSGNTGLSILAPDASYAGIYFGFESDNASMGIQATYNDELQFISRAGIRVTITNNLFELQSAFTVRTSGGNLTLATLTGDVVLSPVGGNIAANSDLEFQQASTISTTSGDLTLNPTSKVVIGSGVELQFATEVADKIYLYSTTYGIGVSAAEFALWSNSGAFRFRQDTRTGTIAAQISGAAGQDSYFNVLGDNFGIGTSSISGKLHIDQPASDGAIPVLFLDQADISEEFIRFVGQSHDGVLTESLVEYGDEASSTQIAWVKVYIVDDNDQITDQAAYVPAYTLSA